MDDIAMRRCIESKRLGNELAPEVWEDIVASYVAGTVDDAQMAAMAMACIWRGMSVSEAAAMTRAIVASGETLSYPDGIMVVDKHSSGGVSDIISLIAVPIVAACGTRVAKLSGRALGHTGGTIDKLETIPGFNVALSMDDFVRQVGSVGCAIAAQTDAFVPADKRLYKLRDRTGTVPNLGLIASSIVSKKVAGGAHAFVFDVKCGEAAFMQKPHEAIALAEALVAISQQFGRRARAIVSDMNEPLGRSIGTGIEIVEAREFLRGETAIPRVKALCLEVSEAMLELAGVSDGADDIQRALSTGAAYEKFCEMIEAQGGSVAAFEAMRRSPHVTLVKAAKAGFVQEIDTVALGNAARSLSDVDPMAGVRVAVREGESVGSGAVLAEIFSEKPDIASVVAAFRVDEAAPPSRPLVYATV
ncbi:MAG: thymidine phosphorylase [Candidatus Eremiobacteraeota bacterium]|nr:thymidine phosphorylase [Candidatus Eremiobacteraeota bacterium]